MIGRRALCKLTLTFAVMAAGAGCGPEDGGPEVGGQLAADLTLAEAVGQMLMVGFRGASLDREAAAMLRGIRPGGVVLFDYDAPSKGAMVRNITSPQQLRELTSAIQATGDIPYAIAIDAEGGYVNRLKAKYGFTVTLPSAQTLGGGAPADTRRAAEALADSMQDLGLNWNFAPVVDVNIDPESPAIGAIERSFGGDPAVVAAHALAFVQAHHERQIVTALKHFPGHGSASGDTHLGVTNVTDTYRRTEELAPYRTLIDGGYDAPIMTAHVVNSNLDPSGRPATLSHDIMTKLLRNELGFEGVIISDDMQMGAIAAAYGPEEAVLEAITAGVDIVLLANQQGAYDIQRVYRVRDAIVRAVQDGVISADRIYASAARILALKRAYGIWN